MFILSTIELLKYLSLPARRSIIMGFEDDDANDEDDNLSKYSKKAIKRGLNKNSILCKGPLYLRCCRAPEISK